jgi:hypothetical protein
MEVRYYKNEQGKVHREDGPAVIFKSGTKLWYYNGVKHRYDGPAIEQPDGYKRWFLNGVEYSEKEYKIKMRSYKISNIID